MVSRLAVLLLGVFLCATAQAETVTIVGPCHAGNFVAKGPSGQFQCYPFISNSNVTVTPYLGQGLYVNGLASGATAAAATASGQPLTYGQAGASVSDMTSAKVTWSATHFASLGAAVNGQRMWCDNCDPPANPPVACTDAGAKTGAFADGVNGVWLCVP